LSQTSATPSQVTTEDVQRYWNEHPLFSLEVTEGYGQERFFHELERIKSRDVEVYTQDYWNFAGYAGQSVLDLGCGPGWYSAQYGLGGANVTGVDLTPKAVEVASAYAKFRGLANVVIRQGDAQDLPFADDSFDLVISSGVLHHVPDPVQAFREVRRVLKPGGEAKITLYYRNFLLRNPLAFRAMLLALRTLKVRHHDVASGQDPKSPDDFVRMYDGRDNPLGVAFSDARWTALLRQGGLRVTSRELHFFPLRFLPQAGWLRPMRRFCDGRLGFLIYYRLRPEK
jgi:SAM-dependent methyltransferase